MLLKGLGNVKGMSSNRKLPITPNILLSIRHQLNFNEVSDINFWAACLTLFFSFLRKSNVFPVSRSTPANHRIICRGDVRVLQEDSLSGLLLLVRWSKTIQAGQRILSCPLPLLPNHPLCPCAALIRAFLLTPLPANSFLFHVRSAAGGLTPMTYVFFITKLRSILDSFGLCPSRYSGHSFRRGGASWALQQGLSVEAIKILGDWHSDAYSAYLSMPLSHRFQSAHQFSADLPTTPTYF